MVTSIDTAPLYSISIIVYGLNFKKNSNDFFMKKNLYPDKKKSVSCIAVLL